MKRPTIGEFTLVEHLGSSNDGSCNVFAATRPSSSEVFAVKVLRGGNASDGWAIPRFEREAGLTCVLDHPHLCRGLESGSDETGDCYLAMTLLRGKSLAAILQDCGRLEWRTATQLMLHVARAIVHLDSLGIVHRDVKPENIMITRTSGGDAEEEGEPLVHSSCNGAAALGVTRPPKCGSDAGSHAASAAFSCDDLTAVLIDMGLARRTSEHSDEPHHGEPPPGAASGGLGGAPADAPLAPPPMRRVASPAWSAICSSGFMAPEQVRDARVVQSAVDVYGLGTTWYATLTGVLPFSGSSPLKAMQQALNGEAVPATAHVPDLPPAVVALLSWLIQKEARARPPCAASLVAEIEATLADPHDAQRVARARQAHDKRRQLQAALTSARQIAAVSVGTLLLAWLSWETLGDASEPPTLYM